MYLSHNSKIYVAGHTGLVGSSLVRALQSRGYNQIVQRTHAQLDLTCQQAVRDFFEKEKPEYVFLAAARVGGIMANSSYPAQFFYENMAIELNVIQAATEHHVKRLLFMGSSCIYPRVSTQPIEERSLLSGYLEPTNRAYAIAKIAGIEMCRAYNQEYGTQYLGVMPTNLYGKRDNYHPDNSHVIPGLIRRVHEAKIQGHPTVTVWGSGHPKREFLSSDDLASACLFLMNLSPIEFMKLCAQQEPIINIGSGQDLTIRELAEMIKKTIGYVGEFVWDETKPDGTPRKLLNINKMISLGWEPSIELEQGLKMAYQDFKEVHDESIKELATY